MAVRIVAARRRPGVGEVVTLLACATAVAVGWFTRTVVPAHADLRAESLPAFFWASLRFGAWPAYQYPLCAVVVYLPLVWLGWRWWRGQRPAGLLLAFGGWAGLQTLALAYGRGGHAAPPVCRYMDLLAVAPLVGFLAWGPLAAGAGRFRRLALAGATAWTALLVLGLWPETDKDFTGWMPNYRREMDESERNTHGYVATHDFTRFLVGKPIHSLPYPNPTLLASFLDDPTLRPILPPDIRSPLQPDTVAGETAPTFVVDGLPPAVHPPPETACLGSYAAAGNPAQGTWRARYTAAAGLPYVSLAFAGDIGDEGLSFALKDANGPRQITWHPVHPPGERWHTDLLALPAKRFELEATDGSNARWFAFTAPVEVGFWSRWTGFALRRGAWLAGAGLLLAATAELAARRGNAAGGQS
ncbi:MAG: hypothetical protein INR65_18465 [Gluconacetobacter diazotrophicus]|nr:hypothetical protein [Gluconacetobacter diazotrophicus]